MTEAIGASLGQEEKTPARMLRKNREAGGTPDCGFAAVAIVNSYKILHVVAS